MFKAILFNSVILITAITSHSSLAASSSDNILTEQVLRFCRAQGADIKSSEMFDQGDQKCIRYECSVATVVSTEDQAAKVEGHKTKCVDKSDYDESLDDNIEEAKVETNQEHFGDTQAEIRSIESS